MASYSLSPDEYGSSSGRGNDPLASLNTDLIKTVEGKKAGAGPKRRGPKPDSKPAMTRRQELNRKAQRTHRERKENYIRALEDEIIRLKQDFASAVTDKDRLAEENQRLKALLSQVGSSPDGKVVGGGGLTALDDSMSNPSVGFSSAASITGSFAPHSSNTSAFTASPLQAKNSRYTSEGLSPQPASQSHLRADDVNVASPNPSLDYEQAGIDFVLTCLSAPAEIYRLERPCMSHLPYLLERGTAAGGQEQPSGHALMASCPPQPFKQLTDDIPFGYTNVNVNTTINDGVPSIGNPTGEKQRTWELKKADLATLMDLSKKLNLDGEVTPVMAWGMVLAHPRLSELKPQDLAKLADELVGKVGCYGFGAVLEEFEVRDALENILSTLPETVSAF